MSDAPEIQVVGVFHERSALEHALETLQSHGLERSQLSVLGSADTLRGRLGLPVAEPTPQTETEHKTPVDVSEQQNMTPLLAGLPASLGALLAAGVTVASGGTLAGAAVAALLGGAGAGAVGAGAASAFRDAVEGSYAAQIKQGGILLLVHPRSAADVERARDVLARFADRQVEMAPDRSLT